MRCISMAAAGRVWNQKKRYSSGQQSVAGKGDRRSVLGMRMVGRQASQTQRLGCSTSGQDSMRSHLAGTPTPLGLRQRLEYNIRNLQIPDMDGCILSHPVFSTRVDKVQCVSAGQRELATARPLKSCQTLMHSRTVLWRERSEKGCLTTIGTWSRPAFTLFRCMIRALPMTACRRKEGGKECGPKAPRLLVNVLMASKKIQLGFYLAFSIIYQ